MNAGACHSFPLGPEKCGGWLTGQTTAFLTVTRHSSFDLPVVTLYERFLLRVWSARTLREDIIMTDGTAKVARLMRVIDDIT
jgi:hypothetical protein